MNDVCDRMFDIGLHIRDILIHFDKIFYILQSKYEWLHKYELKNKSSSESDIR